MLSLLLLLALHAGAQEWACVQHDPQHTGRSPRTVSDVLPSAHWTADTKGSVFGSPVIRADDSIVLSTGTEKKVTALSGAGSVLWSYPAVGAVYGSPAVLADGKVLFNDTEGWVYTLNANGTLNASFQNTATPKTEKRFMCDMTPRSGGGYATGDWRSKLIFNTGGASNAEYSLPGSVYPYTAIAFSGDGTKAYWAYRSSTTGTQTVCINPSTGASVWSVIHTAATGGRASMQASGVCLDETNSRLFFSATYSGISTGSYLYAYNTSGTRLTGFPIDIGAGSYATPALSPDGSAVYITTLDGRLIKYNAITGAKIWTYDSGSQAIRGSAVVDAAGKVIFGDMSGVVHCVDANGSPKWKYDGLKSVIASAPAIASNGDIIVASTSGKVVRLGEPVYVIPYIQTTPTLDGTLSPNEWNGAWRVSVDVEQDPLVNPGWDYSLGRTLTKDDCSYTFYVMHNGTSMFVALDINDDVVMATQAPVPDTPPPTNGTAAQTLYQVWFDDCTEVFIDTDMDDKNEGQGWPTNTDWQEGIHPHFGALGHVWTRPDNPSLSGTWGTVFNNAVFAVSKKRTGGYVQEWEIKMNKFDTQDGAGFTALKPGDTIGFNVLVNDDDEYNPPNNTDTREDQVIWWGSSVAGYSTGSNPETWPHALLSTTPIVPTKVKPSWKKYK